MPMKTIKEIEDFVSGTVVTELIIEGNDYPYYYLNESCLGWAEYLDTNAFDPFELLGFTVKIVRIDVDSDYEDVGGELDSAISSIINKNGESLTQTLTKLQELGAYVSVRRV